MSAIRMTCPNCGGVYFAGMVGSTPWPPHVCPSSEPESGAVVPASEGESGQTRCGGSPDHSDGATLSGSLGDVAAPRPASTTDGLGPSPAPGSVPGVSRLLTEQDAERRLAAVEADMCGEIEALRVRSAQMSRGLSEYEANEDAWPDEDSRARHNRVEEILARAVLEGQPPQEADRTIEPSESAGGYADVEGLAADGTPLRARRAKGSTVASRWVEEIDNGVPGAISQALYELLAEPDGWAGADFNRKSRWFVDRVARALAASSPSPDEPEREANETFARDGGERA